MLLWDIEGHPPTPPPPLRHPNHIQMPPRSETCPEQRVEAEFWEITLGRPSPDRVNLKSWTLTLILTLEYTPTRKVREVRGVRS